MLTGRKILVYFAIKYEGDWEKIFNAIINKEEIDIKEDKFEEELSKMKYSYLTILDEHYPTFLKQIYRPPFVLFYYGKISYIFNDHPILAVVGSRDNSEYGKFATEKIISELPTDYVIVSGLAKGIDSIAHKAALNCGMKTIAVLGCGIDYCYPQENSDLYETIKKDHLLISEYPGNTIARKEQFPIRNRIIAGLSNGVLITEAKLKSGSMITANFAIEQNKDLFCVPHPINKESGGNYLIAQGAYLVQSGNDINIQFLESVKNVK